MAFWLKKLVASVLYPIPVVLVLLAVGLIFLMRNRARKVGLALTSAAFLLLLFVSLDPVASRALATVEHTYPVLDVSAIDTAAIDWIVVLDGGFAADPTWPPEQQMSRSSQSRFVEGMRLARSLPGARLLFSGGSAQGSKTGSRIMERAARDWGVPAQRIVVEDRSWDTDDQARLIRDIVGSDSLILVTSASHLPRAVALFRNQGMDPLPAPADFSVPFEQERLFVDYIPSSSNVVKFRSAMYEWMGHVWASFKGHI